MEFKGTKGGFVIKDRDKNGVFITNNTGSFAVARVFKGSNLTLEEFEANAKLIAAAPDLLEALIRLTANAGLQKYVRDNQGTLLSESFDKATQAIEKALK